MTDAAAAMNGRRKTREKKIGVVGVPGGWSSERLADNFAELTGFRLLLDCAKLVVHVSTGEVHVGNVRLNDLDAIVIKKIGSEYSPDMLDRLEILRYLEAQGVPVFSKPAHIMRLLDRLSCTLTLSAAGILMPQTIVTEDVAEAVRAVEQFGQAVFKPLYSTKARGMRLLSAQDPELRNKLLEISRGCGPVLYLQERLELPDRDLSLVYVGGQYAGTYARVRKPGAWNTTTHAGGHYKAHQPSDEVIGMAQRAQALFEMDLTSVDVAETNEGPKIFEVSAFGGYRGLWEGAQIDAGSLLARHVLTSLDRRTGGAG